MSLIRIGQVDNTGDVLALFKKNFLTEVIAAFDEVNVFDKLVQSRSITEGKSVSFPVTWKTTAQRYIPGITADLSGTNTVKQNEVVINIDYPLAADILIPQFDELLNHWDVRQEFSKQMGAALAREKDKIMARILILAARKITGDAVTKGKTTRNRFFSATMATDGDVLIANLFKCAQQFVEQDIPVNPQDITAVVRPAQWYLLAQNAKIMTSLTGNGTSLMTGAVPTLADIGLIKSNNIPNTVVGADTGAQNDYSGDFTSTVAIVAHRTAAASVNRMNVTTEQEYLIQKQATLMVAKTAFGAGITRPEAAIELTSEAS